MLVYIPLIDHYSQYKIGRDDLDNLSKVNGKRLYSYIFNLKKGLKYFQ